MTYDDVPPLYRYTWSVYESLRKLGFQNDQISYVAGRVLGQLDAGEQVVVVLTVGDKACRFTIGPLDRPFQEASALLDRVFDAIRDGSIDDPTLERMWQTSPPAVLACFQAMSVTIAQKGIALPGLERMRN